MLYSYVLVAVQFLALVFLAWYGGVLGDVLSNSLLALAGLIGLSAMITMRFRFNIVPEIRTDQTFFVGGPYAFIRHPMYTAVLLAGIAWFGNRPDLISFCIWLVLCIDLRLKLAYEERLLMSRFSGYTAYMTRTKRLIPWVY
jgi:protein-S-isoprenylcysteine O-methyltransferase Ste14